MTNEEERQLCDVIAECRRPEWEPGVHMIDQLEARRDTLADLAERLLKENSELRVRDSNVTMHSLNVMAVNEDLVGKINNLKKIVRECPDTAEAYDEMLAELGVDFDWNPLP